MVLYLGGKDESSCANQVFPRGRKKRNSEDENQARAVHIMEGDGVIFL